MPIGRSEIEDTVGTVENAMRKCCSTCGEGLSVLDVMQGRIDHPECWEKKIVRLLPEDKEISPSSTSSNVASKIAQILSPNARPSH
jgi:hypothetical protein